MFLFLFIQAAKEPYNDAWARSSTSDVAGYRRMNDRALAGDEGQEGSWSRPNADRFRRTMSEPETSWHRGGPRAVLPFRCLDAGRSPTRGGDAAHAEWTPARRPPSGAIVRGARSRCPAECA